MIDNWIIGGRQTGRSTALIEEAAANNKYIVVTDHLRALYLWNRARELGLSIPFPITLRELPIRRSVTFIESVLVDDADALLERIVGVHIDTIVLEYPEKQAKLTSQWMVKSDPRK